VAGEAASALRINYGATSNGGELFPIKNNGMSIYKLIETAYLHADSIAFGCGAVLNDGPNYQARGFWTKLDRQHHITWKELRAARHAVESFLIQL
jgi:hypothetical protein